MLSVIFIVLLLLMFGKLLLFGVKVAWGLGKFFLSLVCLPLILVGMAVSGLIYLAIFILIVVVAVLLFKD